MLMAPTDCEPPTTTTPPTTVPHVKTLPIMKGDNINEHTTTTQSLNEIVNQFPTRDQGTTTEQSPSDVNVVLIIEALESKLTIMIGLLTVSLAESTAAILISVCASCAVQKAAKEI